MLFSQLKMLEQKLKKTEIMNQKAIEIIETISKITSVDLIYQKILEAIFQLFHFDIGLIFTEKNNFLEYTRGDYRKDSNAFEKFKAIDQFFKEQKGYELSMMDGASPVCYFRKSPLYFKNIEAVKHLPMSQKDKQGIEILKTPISAFIVPFLKDQAPIGIIQFWTVDKEIDLSEHDHYIMNLLCSFIGTAIANSEIYSLVEKQKKELENKNQIIETKNYQFLEELKLAKTIQQSLIPSVPPNIPGIRLASLYKPMEDVGGDLFDFIKIREPNLFGIFISDVSGHGVPAALITSMVKTLVETAGEKRVKPAELLEYMNKKLLDQTGGNFLTAFYAVYDISNSILTYARGAHNPPFVIRGNEIITLNACGKVLAIWEDVTFEQKQIKLFPGDKILFYTDGLTEAVNSQNLEFEELLPNFMIKNSNLSAQNFKDALYHALLNHREDYHFEDDVCIVVMEIC
jgi:serine phosphatase RsbU (regulator of sigma subunit)